MVVADYKGLNQLYLFAHVKSQEPDVQWLSFVVVLPKCSLFFIYIYQTIGFLFEWFILAISLGLIPHLHISVIVVTYLRRSYSGTTV